MGRRLTTRWIIVGLALALAGCAGLKPAPVKPWEKESLSHPGMQPIENTLISSCDDHIYFSREASKGGRSFGGGGCGCN